MDDLSQDEINEIVTTASGKIDNQFAMLLTHFMCGYLRHADDIELTKQAFFRQIKRHLDEKEVK